MDAAMEGPVAMQPAEAVETLANNPDALGRICAAEIDLVPQDSTLAPRQPLGLPPFPIFPDAPIPSTAPQLLPPPLLVQRTAQISFSVRDTSILSDADALGNHGNIRRRPAISAGGFALGSTTGLLVANILLWYRGKRRRERIQPTRASPSRGEAGLLQPHVL